MKSLSAAMIAHLAQKRTTIARAYKVTRKDTAVYGFTSHVRSITIDGVLYRSDPGLSGSALQSGASLAADNMEMRGAFRLYLITEEDVYAGDWSYAKVEIFDFNYRDLSMGTIPQPGGFLGEIRAGRGAFTTELWGLSKLLQNPIGRQYLPACPWNLGDAHCKIDLDTFTNGKVTTTVTAVTDRRIFTASGLTTPAGWSTWGVVRWLTGLNANRRMEVRLHDTGGVITLHLPMFRALAVGDSFEISAGCLKRIEEDCITKFANPKNHGGFSFMPGLDRIMTGK